jgi:hypothetical protein
LQGERPSRKELFFVDWGLETFKNNIKTANDSLARLLTLSTALTAGSVIWPRAS